MVTETAVASTAALAADSSPRVSRGRAIVMLVLVNVFWGLSFPVTKTINLEVDDRFMVAAADSSTALRLAAASWLTFCRFSLAALMFAVLFHRELRRSGPAEWKAGAWIGSFFFVGLMLQIIALATISASRGGFLTSLVAVYTPLITALLLFRLPARRIVAGVLVAMLGVAILTELVELGPGLRIASGAAGRWTAGDTLTTLAALFFTGQIMLVDHFGRRLDAAAMTPGMFVSAAALALVTFLVVRPLVPEHAATGWIQMTLQPRFYLLVACLSMLSTVLSLHWMNTYQHHVTASQAGIIYTLEPVFASLAAMFLPGMLTVLVGVQYQNERVVLPLVLGGGLIVSANLISLYPRRKGKLGKHKN